MFIYRLLNNATGKSYIGQTINAVEKRITAHKSTALRGRGRLLHQAIRKHGWGAFTFETLEECVDGADMDMAERFWIDTINSLAPHGYNLESGGNANKIVGEAARARMSAAQTGLKTSAEARRRMSEAQKGRPGIPKTPEIRALISASLTGRRHSPERIAGRPSRTGDKHPNAKLTWEAVREIRSLHATGTYSYGALALMFAINKTHAFDIVRRKKWIE